MKNIHPRRGRGRGQRNTGGCIMPVLCMILFGIGIIKIILI